MAQGSPEQVAASPKSWTGRYLAEILEKHDKRRNERRAKRRA